jgi:hypothetical protein
MSRIEGGSVGLQADVGAAPASGLHHIAKPTDAGALGHYRVSVPTGTLTAGLAAGGQIFSLRWADATRLLVLKSLNVKVLTLTPFTGATLSDYGSVDAVVARSFTVAASGGTAVTLTGNNAKVRTSMATSLVNTMQVATTAALTAGTQTLDAQAFKSSLVRGNRTNPAAATEEAVASTDNGLALNFNVSNGEYPIVLAANEGIVIRNRTVWPIAGTAMYVIDVAWAEVTAY